MTSEDGSTDGDVVLTLQELMQLRRKDRGWRLSDLAKRAGGRISYTRLRQIETEETKQANDPATVRALADILDVDVTTVWLAVGRSLGLDVRRSTPMLVHLLPAGVEHLPIETIQAIAAVARAAVLQMRDTDPGDPGPAGLDAADEGLSGAQVVELPPPPGERRNAVRRSGESDR